MSQYQQETLQIDVPTIAYDDVVCSLCFGKDGRVLGEVIPGYFLVQTNVGIVFTNPYTHSDDQLVTFTKPVRSDPSSDALDDKYEAQGDTEESSAYWDDAVEWINEVDEFRVLISRNGYGDPIRFNTVFALMNAASTVGFDTSNQFGPSFESWLYNRIGEVYEAALSDK